MPFQEATVDHVLPESLVDDEAKRASVVAMYGLAPSFEINSFENWVPAHPKCNQRKSENLFTPSPAMVFILGQVSGRAKVARETAVNAIADKRKGRILGRLESALEAATITREELERLLAGLPQEPMIQNVTIALQVTPQWTVVHEINGLAAVTDGQRAGITPIVQNPHHSWECPNCGQYGPWNGVICMSCGRMSDPWD